MAIQCELETRILSDAEFDRIDAAVMASAYASQNRLGKLCEERVYENDLACRLRADGWDDVHTQVAVKLNWGGFLSSSVFEEALVALHGGEDVCMKRLPVVRDGIELGYHAVALYDDHCGFVVTGLGGESKFYEHHLKNLLKTLPISHYQWMNFDRLRLTMVTVSKD